MFCPKCGESNVDEAKFCAKCGAPLVENTILEQPQGPEAGSQVTAPQGPEAGPQMTAPQEGPQMTAPQGGPQAGPQMTAPQGAPQMTAPQAAPRKPMSKSTLNIIIAAAAVCVALIIFIIAGNVLSNPKRTVEKYFKAASSGNWEKVYNYVDIPDGEFITKDLLAKAFEDEDTMNITNFEVVENESNTSGISKQYYITYFASGSSKRTTRVEVVRDGRFMLFWQRYKISADDIVAQNIKFTVRDGSKLYIDGIEVKDSYIVEEKDDSSTNKTYKIDYLFMGDHEIKVVSDVYHDVEKNYSITSSSMEYTVTTTDIKDEIVAARMTAAENDMQTFYEAAIAKKDFNDLKSLCVSDDTQQKSIKSLYDTFVTRTYNNGYGVAKIDFTDFSETTTTGVSKGVPYVSVTVTAKVNATVNIKPTSYNNNATSKSVTDTIKDVFRYEYHDGEWKISSVSLDRVTW